MRFRTPLIAVGFVAAMSFGPGLIGSASASTPAPVVTPVFRTCADFRAWLAHRDTVNLDNLMTASEGVPWKYLGDDVTQLYSGVRSGDAKYVAYAVKYVKEDCASTAIVL